jgi:hypothetical protein
MHLASSPRHTETHMMFGFWVSNCRKPAILARNDNFGLKLLGSDQWNGYFIVIYSFYIVLCLFRGKIVYL